MRRASRTDANHREGARALDLMGFPYLDTHAAGGGLEDYIFAVQPKGRPSFWCMLEMKCIEYKNTGYYRHTKAQREWMLKTASLPRIVATGFEDALAKLRALAEA